MHDIMDIQDAQEWLGTMQTFCEQLQLFLKNEVPSHSRLEDYTLDRAAGWGLRTEYACLLFVCTNPGKIKYMEGIPKLAKSQEGRQQLERQLKMTVDAAVET